MAKNPSGKLTWLPSKEAERCTREYAKYCGYRAYATGESPTKLTALGKAYYNIANRLTNSELRAIAQLKK